MHVKIKSAVTDREIRILRALSREKSVLEVGSLLGFSTVHMAHEARSLVSIDPHSGYPYYNPVPTLPIFQRNIERYGVSQKVEVVRSTAQEAPKVLERTFDLAFVDCTGFYEDTRFCLEHIRSGIIAVHDFGRASCQGVDRAVLEFVKGRKKDLTVIGTLALIQ